MIPKHIQLIYIEALTWGKVGSTSWCNTRDFFIAYHPGYDPFATGPLLGLQFILEKEEKEAYNKIVGKFKK